MMKHLKKTASAVLIAFLLVFSSYTFILADSGWDGTTETPCTEGTGDLDNPYLISTPEELAWFRTQINKGDLLICAKLTDDIDLNGKQWVPIGGVQSKMPTGNKNTGYGGVFDGNNHTISGLYISIDNNRYWYIGLFGFARGNTDNPGSEAIIKNLTIKGNISTSSNLTNAPWYIGGILGGGRSLKVINCTSDVDISIGGNNSGQYGGGIIGVAALTVTIDNCVNTGDISGNLDTAGGLIGGTYPGGNTVVTNCCNFGNVSGNKKIGGLAGSITGTVNNCYNAGNITATAEDGSVDGSGGIIGLAGTSTLSIENCFTTGICNFSYDSYTGAVYGRVPSGYIITFNNVFYLDTSCSRPCGVLSPKYNEDNPNTECYKTISKDAEFIASTDFVDLLNLNAGSTVFKKGSTHPIFVWQKEESAPVGTKGDIDGNGTVNATDVSELISRIANDNVPDNAVADMNGDGTVNATDVSELISVIAAE